MATHGYKTRPYHKPNTNKPQDQDRCNCCGYNRPGEVVLITDFPTLPPVCKRCSDFFYKMESETPGDYRTLVTVAKFIVDNEDTSFNKSGKKKVQLARNAEIDQRIKAYQIKIGWDTFEDALMDAGGRLAYDVDNEIAAGKLVYNEETDKFERPNSTTENQNITTETQTFEDPYHMTEEEIAKNIITQFNDPEVYAKALAEMQQNGNNVPSLRPKDDEFKQKHEGTNIAE